MLGAKARAAEYYAAKAASARQQASRDADEHKLPSKPAPVSLSSFTKNASFNRNKGPKIFKPLILSEEEERSGSSLEIETDLTKSPSPPPLPPPQTPGPRAASLPPPQVIQIKSAEVEHNVQTPSRYKNTPPIVPFAPQTMLQDDIHQHVSHAPSPFHFVSYAHPQPVLNQSIPAPQLSWYYPSGPNGTDHSYSQAGMPPMLSFSDPSHPSFQHNDLHVPNLEAKKGFSDIATKVRRLEYEKEPQRRQIGGPTLHNFGPDDVTPTKIEVKERVRRELLAKMAVAGPTPPTAVHVKQVNTPEPHEAKDKEETTGSTQGLIQCRKDAEDNASFPEYGDYAKAIPYGPETAANWPYLGRNANFRKSAEILSDKSARKASANDNLEEKKEFKQTLLDSLLERPETTIRPPPGLEHVRMERSNSVEQQFEQITNIKFPLKSVHSEEWCEVRPITAEERRRMRDVMRTIAVSSISDKNRDLAVKMVGVEREDFKKWVEETNNAQVIRRARVDELAKEMQRKWEHGGAFRYSTMTKDEANINAGTVKAVASILSTLSSHSGDGGGLHFLGSRPYCQPPEYAIERGVGLKGNSITSLFESDEDENIAAPPRLARDPRFRPQLEGLKVRAAEDRIPILPVFAAARRLRGDNPQAS